ncbi:MAG TPA: MerR family transcriptional regulator [bacterium]|nr:MerR family transcriptional regulator [bacterium]
MRKKTPTRLYYSITEVAGMTGVPPHVLRYWETEFKALRPKKNRAGNRIYRSGDIKLILLIKKLLYEDGFTIAGAKRKLPHAKSDPDVQKHGRKTKRDELVDSLKRDLMEMRDLLGGA